jgi:hypothetical protein
MEKEKLKDYLNSDDTEVVELCINILYEKGVSLLEIENTLKESHYKICNIKDNYIHIKQNYLWMERMAWMNIMKEEELALMWGKK